MGKAGEAVVAEIGLPSLADDPEIQQAASDINSENYILDETKKKKKRKKKESKVTDQDELKTGEAVVTKIGLPSLADDPEIQQAASDINSENYILDETQKKESKVTDQDELKAGEAVV